MFKEMYGPILKNSKEVIRCANKILKNEKLKDVDPDLSLDIVELLIYAVPPMRWMESAKKQVEKLGLA